MGEIVTEVGKLGCERIVHFDGRVISLLGWLVHACACHKTHGHNNNEQTHDFVCVMWQHNGVSSHFCLICLSSTFTLQPLTLPSSYFFSLPSLPPFQHPPCPTVVGASI